MATTCTIAISSDIAPGFGNISESMTLTQAGTVVDIDSTTGEQPSAAQLQAANLLGKSVALFTDRLEQKTDDRSADEIAEEIQRKIEALTDRPLH